MRFDSKYDMKCVNKKMYHPRLMAVEDTVATKWGLVIEGVSHLGNLL